MWLKDLSHGDFILISGGFAGICGSISYFLNVQEGKVFKCSEFLIHIAVSIIFGVLAFELCSYLGIQDEYCGAMSGMAGFLGVNIAKIIQIVFPKVFNALILKYFGLSKKDLEE